MRTLVLLDSISEIAATMTGTVIVCGSHGGRSAAAFVLGVHPGPHAVFFNDAGIGKERAGIVALDQLARVGIIAAAYRHDSARIGDAGDGLASGVISAVNALAGAAGLIPGQRVTEAVSVLR